MGALLYCSIITQYYIINIVLLLLLLTGIFSGDSFRDFFQGQF